MKAFSALESLEDATILRRQAMSAWYSWLASNDSLPEPNGTIGVFGITTDRRNVLYALADDDAGEGTGVAAGTLRGFYVLELSEPLVGARMAQNVG